jgi:hypothetical protein
VQRGIGDTRVPCTLDSMLRVRKRFMSTAVRREPIAGVFHLLTANF